MKQYHRIIIASLGTTCGMIAGALIINSVPTEKPQTLNIDNINKLNIQLDAAEARLVQANDLMIKARKAMIPPEPIVIVKKVEVPVYYDTNTGGSGSGEKEREENDD